MNEVTRQASSGNETAADGIGERDGVEDGQQDPAPSLPPPPENLRYLAFVEQIPRHQPIYIVGLEEMARWTLRLLRRRGYTADGFIADRPDPPARYEAIPVTERAEFHEQSPSDAVILIASPHRDQLIHEFTYADYLFDVTELFQYVTVFCENDTRGVLLDDLGTSYWRQMPGGADRAGAAWRSLKKVRTDQYVRNIENAVGADTKFVVNIGCNDGVSVDPCYPLYRDGWKGWAVDAISAEGEVGRAAARNLDLPGVSLTLDTAVTPKNITQLLVENDVPARCDLVKVDIDSFDGPVISAILGGGWRPRVFCIEVNADIPPPFRFAVEFDDREPEPEAKLEELGLYGCSAAWAAELFASHGYRFAQYEFGFPKMIGGMRDMVFVREDVFAASQATAALSWDEAFYAEPLGWSHIRAALHVDPRDWRHAKNPKELAPRIEAILRDYWEGVLGRPVPFILQA